MFCESCGKSISDNANVCPYCGNPIRKTEPVPVPAPVFVSEDEVIDLSQDTQVMVLENRNGWSQIVYNNGFGYMELSLPALVALCVALYLVILLLRKKVFLAKEQDAVYRMELFYKENSFRGSALLDTGNGLRNAYSDSEVILLTEDAAKILTGFRVTADVAKMSDLGLPVRLLSILL